jgi:hypothetical protein
MIYKTGDYVLFKNKVGKIVSSFDYNKTYHVELYNYRGFSVIYRQCSQNELYPYKQTKLPSFR